MMIRIRGSDTYVGYCLSEDIGQRLPNQEHPSLCRLSGQRTIVPPSERGFRCFQKVARVTIAERLWSMHGIVTVGRIRATLCNRRPGLLESCDQKKLVQHHYNIEGSNISAHSLLGSR
jgi:hypothetical protein